MLGFVVDSVSTLLAAAAILLYIYFWHKDKTSNSYVAFDSMYLEILKTGIDNPSLRDEVFTQNYTNAENDKRIQYEVYAYICWNFCETLYDQGDSGLMKTWGVVIQEENRLHRTWFEQPSTQSKFKPEFREYILKHFPANA